MRIRRDFLDGHATCNTAPLPKVPSGKSMSVARSFPRQPHCGGHRNSTDFVLSFVATCFEDVTIASFMTKTIRPTSDETGQTKRRNRIAMLRDFPRWKRT